MREEEALLRPRPRGWVVFFKLTGPTLVLCNVCLVLLLLVAWTGWEFFAGGLWLTAVLAAGSGFIVPLAMAPVLAESCYPVPRRAIAGVLMGLSGLAANFVIGVVYLVIAGGVGV